MWQCGSHKWSAKRVLNRWGGGGGCKLSVQKQQNSFSWESWRCSRGTHIAYVTNSNLRHQETCTEKEYHTCHLLLSVSMSSWKALSALVYLSVHLHIKYWGGGEEKEEWKEREHLVKHPKVPFLGSSPVWEIRGLTVTKGLAVGGLP